MSSSRAGAILTFSLLTGCADGCQSESDGPEITDVRSRIEVRDPGSDQGRNALMVEQAEGLVSEQLSQRISQLLEQVRVETLSQQTNPRTRAFMGNNCESVSYGVEEGINAESPLSSAAGYSVQELAMSGINDSLPFVSTVWGEYQDGKFVGGFSVNSVCVPDGVSNEGPDFKKGLKEALFESGLKENLDLSAVLDDGRIMASMVSMDKKDLASGGTQSLIKEAKVSVFFRE